MIAVIEEEQAELSSALRRDGCAFVAAPAMREQLLQHGELADWPAFADSWNSLAVDLHMADGGRYRRRRYAVYHADREQGIHREAHQAHYQSLAYNRLNGGVARWFEPVDEAIGAGSSMQTVLAYCLSLFDSLAPTTQRWHVEVHQFRIEAQPDRPGQPTPEGPHRDGVDYVLVLMIRRHNIASGTTAILTADGAELGSFTLTTPLDAAIVDDARVYHGVTAVEPIDHLQPAYRDVLVVTFRKAD